jgi:hypothetical protein
LALEESPAEFSAMMDENLLSYGENFSNIKERVQNKTDGTRLERGLILSGKSQNAYSPLLFLPFSSYITSVNYAIRV